MSSFVTSTMGHKDRMAGDPSSSHRGEHRDREHRHRSSSSSHRHHRTISSTTLLLVLSLVLAVLAVMLSLPSSTASATGGSPTEGGSSVLNYLTPKRTQALIARESAVAVREAEVARREAELLVGAPGGVVPSPAACPVCSPPMTTTIIETVAAPAATIIKEIVKEDSLTPPGWTGARAEELLERELKIAERERDIGKREENVNRREHDAARRESWIMEQLIALGNDNPQTVEEEYVYEPPVPKRKSSKNQQPYLPPPAEIIHETVIETQTVVVPPPASTRHAPKPSPVSPSQSKTDSSPRTTEVEIVSEYEEPPAQTVPRPRATRPPTRWFG